MSHPDSIARRYCEACHMKAKLSVTIDELLPSQVGRDGRPMIAVRFTRQGYEFVFTFAYAPRLVAIVKTVPAWAETPGGGRVDAIDVSRRVGAQQILHTLRLGDRVRVDVQDPSFRPVRPPAGVLGLARKALQLARFSHSPFFTGWCATRSRSASSSHSGRLR